MTTRSTTATADRPDLAARCCSHARCRHEVPHHFGTRPFAGTSTSCWHQLHVTVRGRTFFPAPLQSSPPPSSPLPRCSLDTGRMYTRDLAAITPAFRDALQALNRRLEH